LRPKLRRLLPRFLTEFPIVKKQSGMGCAVPIDWAQLLSPPARDPLSAPHAALPSGSAAAQQRLQHFLASGLTRYHETSNNPTLDGQSRLSPYLHFGQISAQRMALEARRFSGPGPEAFLEQLIIRRELSDNFCWYNPYYDSMDACPAWAQRTLLAHKADPRPYLYSSHDFERARTHDLLWNAAQLEMVDTGSMHGYMRMYWAKKILEWSASPEEAWQIALRLNNRYQLDGRDPNGYTGIAWSIGGLHDRAWQERLIFGKIRYMNSNGCRRKFDIEQYIATVQQRAAQLNK
jgi:deoxyribodipyrimidine photo-lyase